MPCAYAKARRGFMAARFVAKLINAPINALINA
jgi:hypothetical protein